MVENKKLCNLYFPSFQISYDEKKIFQQQQQECGNVTHEKPCVDEIWYLGWERFRSYYY